MAEPRNFDIERDERINADRTFILCEQLFRRRSGVRPEVLYEYENITADTSAEESHKIVVDLVLAFTVESDRERLKALLDADTDDPVTVADLNRMVQWLIRETLGRPTAASSSSTDGDAKTGTASKETSSIEPVEAPAA